MKNFRMISILAILLSLLVLVSCDFAPGQQEAVNTPGEETLYQSSSGAKTPAPADSKEAIALASLEARFSDVGTVFLDDYLLAFYIMPDGGQQFADDMVLAKQGDSDARKEWNKIKLNMIAMSKSISEYLKGYSIILLNPINTDLAYINVTDGDVIINAIDD